MPPNTEAEDYFIPFSTNAILTQIPFQLEWVMCLYLKKKNPSFLSNSFEIQFSIFNLSLNLNIN